MECCRKVFYKILVFLFVLFILTNILLNFFNKDKEFSQSENRVLEQHPLFSVQKLIDGDFAKDYEIYICDQFGLRDFWIGIHSEMLLALGKKENNGIFYGDEGYLLQSFQKTNKEEVNEKLMDINSLADSTKGINKYFMLVPNSTVVLNEKLPYKAPDNNPVSYLNYVKDNLNKSIKYVDVYKKLSLKKNEYIFYKTDHHWTTAGAFYAYEELANKMGFKAQPQNSFEIKQVTNSFYGTSYSKSGFKNVAPDSIELYLPKKPQSLKINYGKDKTSEKLYNLENLQEKDKYAVFLGGNYPLIKITNNTASVDNDEKLLLIKDSYANCFVPFLTPHFSEIYMMDLRYYDDDINILIKENNINAILFLYNEITFLNGG